MIINSVVQEKFEYLWGNEPEQVIAWIETFIKIVDKKSELVPFLLTPEQRYFIEHSKKDSIIAKGRQQGISSVVIALSIRESVIKPYSTSLLASYSQPSTAAVWEKLKQQWNSLPDFIRPKLLTNNRMELKMANGSSIICQNVGNKEISRGSTITGFAHLSEFSLWKNQRKQLSALSQAITEKGRTVIESTANGIGDEFFNLYFQSKDNETSYKPFFFGWVEGKTLFEPEYKEAVKRYKAQKGKLLTEDELTVDEKMLFDIGCSFPQLIWRRLKIANMGLELFNQEFPATDMDCFITSGSSQIFDNRKVDEAEKRLIRDKVKEIPKNDIIGLPTILKNLYGTALKIYETPIAGKRYYFGCDIAEGLGGNRDYSVCVVLDEQGKEQCILRSNKLKPYQFSEILDCLGRYFNKGLLTIETASGGHSCIERLRFDKKYMNMTKHTTYDDLNRQVIHIGFSTNAKTKPMIINDCCEWFETGLLTINSKEIISELKVFQSSDTGKLGAMSGRFDDCVIALALAIVGIKNRFYYNF